MVTFAISICMPPLGLGVKRIIPAARRDPIPLPSFLTLRPAPRNPFAAGRFSQQWPAFGHDERA